MEHFLHEFGQFVEIIDQEFNILFDLFGILFRRSLVLKEFSEHVHFFDLLLLDFVFEEFLFFEDFVFFDQSFHQILIFFVDIFGLVFEQKLDFIVMFVDSCKDQSFVVVIGHIREGFFGFDEFDQGIDFFSDIPTRFHDFTA